MKSIDLLKAFNDIDDKFLLEAEIASDSGKKKTVEFKRYKMIAGSLAAMLAVAVLVTNFIRPFNDPDIGNEIAQEANPMTECSSLEDASGITGFDMSVPDSISGEGISSILVYSGSMIEVNYGNNCYIRKEAGSEDISGDYSEYGFTKDISVGDITVTMKGYGDLIKLATWNNEGFTYALHIEKGMTLDEVKGILDSIR